MIRQRVRRTVSAYNLKRERRERTGKLERTDDLMTPDPPPFISVKVPLSQEALS